ncbi:hypothetical protein CTA23_16370 [Salmonella enterica]|nr:hypothetical protein [Salmonella enterica subsp. enterica serovar Rubislaw]EDI4726613.1 hypothetical protein [Salmonella enterica subsp. enterica serovar Muenchen]EDI7538438.1 hypothetical protein [Salmonella enterica]EDJ3201121.1 hypothetical protein [Salmonella enterica subsp. enterica serovar Poona]EDJ4403982.1 hypothetical protein [Salmonella enterica]
MPNLKMMFFVTSLPLVLAGCTSGANVPCPVKIKPQPPAAWAMEPPSNSLLMLDKTFLISGPELSVTRKS